MMTSTTANTVKEDGSTPTDPHDVGAGRIDLNRAGESGLLLDESTANFLYANPDMGGDPSKLNIASMMKSNCVGKCSWARTFEGATNDNKAWNLSATMPDGVGLKINPTSQIVVKNGHSKEVRFEADTTYADTGWNYAEVQLTPQNGSGPALHLPLAVYVAPSTDVNLFTKSVDAGTASGGEILNYELSIINGSLDGPISLVDKEPKGARFVPGSATSEVTLGTIVQDVEMNGQFLTFSAELDKGGVEVISDIWDPDNGFFGGTPFGYLDLPGDYGVGPLPCSSTCDDTSITLTGLPPFMFDGVAHTSLVMGTNGIIIPGDDDNGANVNANQEFPDPTAPNAIAPFWTDLDMDGTGDNDTGAGTWYAAVFNSGAFTVLEWQGVEEWGVPGVAYTIQIQIGNVGSGYEGIWFTYARLDGEPGSLTVGAENMAATSGSNYYYNGAGMFPIAGFEGELKVQELIGGTATINFQMEADCSVEAIVNEATISTADQSERAVAVTRCE